MNINDLITSVNDVIWGDCLIYVLIVCGLWFTWRTRFMQFRMIGEMFRLLTDAAVDTAGTKKQEEDKTKKNISSFQAFIVSVATRVGTGNLAGVASAIAIGGPGAIFWMWVIALIGSATAFVESTLAQLYKQKDKDSYIGGPAYYIQKGLKKRWMAIFYAVTKDFLARTGLKFAEGATDTGVIVSWNTEGAANVEGNVSNCTLAPGGISINPINWKRDNTYAPVKENLGSLTVEGKLVVPGIADARVDTVRGSVVVTTVDAKLYGIPADGAALFGSESYHLHDYGFFYNNFKQNVTDRVKAYMEK